MEHSFAEEVKVDRISTGVVHANPLLKGAVINKARIIERLFTRRNEFLIWANAVLEGLDCGIFGLSHGVQCLDHCAPWRELMRGCALLPGRFAYTTIGQSIKQRDSELNANRLRDKIRRWPISITLRFTAEGGGSFHATLWQLHSMECSLLAEGQVTAVRMDRQSSRSRLPPPAIREGLRGRRRIVTVWITSRSRNQ